MLTFHEESRIRQTAFDWLASRLAAGEPELRRADLLEFTVDGRRLPLIDQSRGIRNPASFSATLSILTTQDSPYADQATADGLLHYAYRTGTGGDNIKLQRAHQQGVPIIYFEGVRPGVYVPHFPAYVVGDDQLRRTVLVALDESMRFFRDPFNLTHDERSYAERIVKQRLHQPAFRARVTHAYLNRCAICDLKHLDLLDAAHIIGDAEVLGLAQTTNGLALCKIHHAAYDRNLLGISAEYEVRINERLLDEVDGPMLRHGLQDMHGRRITIPARRTERPNVESLAKRFAEFASA